MVEKFIISAIYKSNILLGIYLKFYKKEIQIHPPGEPREQHLGEVRHVDVGI